MRDIGIMLDPTVEPRLFVSKMKEQGFTASFTELFEDAKLLQVADLFAKEGIYYDEIHAPFDHINDMWIAGEDGDAMYRALEHTVDMCAVTGVRAAVVHLSSGNTPPAMSDVGFARYDRLIERAAKKGVKIAFENIRKLYNVAYMMEMYPNDPTVGFCWDVGHEHCYTRSWEFMPLFGNRMICNHIHDNDGIQDKDQHLIPFDGSLNYARMAEHFRNSGFKGPLMLEVSLESARGNLDLDTYMRRTADAAKRLRVLVDGE